jgi:hypothetical protein
MIRRMLVSAYGDVDVLAVDYVAPPALRPGTLRIRVAAAGVNFADLLMRMGLYPEAPPRPFTPGYEVAGTVVERSPEAEAEKPHLTPGARVLAVTRFGGYAEEVVVPAHTVSSRGMEFRRRSGFGGLPHRRMALVDGSRSPTTARRHSVAGGVGAALRSRGQRGKRSAPRAGRKKAKWRGNAGPSASWIPIASLSVRRFATGPRTDSM